RQGTRPLSGKPDSALVGEFHASPNFEPRRGAGVPSMLLLHYTGVERAAQAIDWLCSGGRKGSAPYMRCEDCLLTPLVREDKRAWHAGLAVWAGETDINSLSIGIEVQNAGHELGYPNFPEPQLGALEALCRDIISRHCIRPERVLAHSDVA